ncbi:hypothetical protein H5410_007778 [Solanum commersonii]|uniref:Retrotransposon gag domain-containing protein n=1 Tax=Solanum commersonii TaxID=4109 RepID=A0A9J6ADE4_SOLCO|nr:hypothetical protein H5410_007778 [Solanum commersonii]
MEYQLRIPLSLFYWDFHLQKLILQHLVSEHSPKLCGYSTMTNDMIEIKAMLDRMTLEMANFTMRQNQIEEQHENAIAALRESINTATTEEKRKGVTSSEAPGDIYTPSENPMSRPNMLYPTWDEYAYTLVGRFGGDYEDLMSEFKLVRQVGSAKEYQREFDRIMTKLFILPEHAISGFITWLKLDIDFTVKSHRPFTLRQAY